MIPYTNISGQQLLEIYVAYQILSAAVQSLSPPTTSSNGFYVFCYKFSNLLIADFKSYAQKALPPATPTTTTTSSETSVLTLTTPTSSTTSVTPAP